MPTITFKAKPNRLTLFADNGDMLPGRLAVKVPKITRSHCDMGAFRSHRGRIGQLCNSDMFLSVVARAVKALGIGMFIDIENPPEGVTVDSSGFLAVVSIELE